MSKRTGSSKTPTKKSPADAEITHSIIVPAYKEKANIRPLTTRLFAAFEDSDSPIPADSVEVIVVDDNSRDGSVEEVDALQEEGYNVRIVVRTTERGLSSAVVRGFREARGEAMICMDADLQHPPESAPKMLNSLTEKKPFVLGTRYGPGVEMDKDWPMHRRVISTGARLLARPLTTVSDPMSGFFGIQKKYFNQASDINQHGFKVALDLLLKAPIPINGVTEVPFSFGTRKEGESKLTGKVMLRYVEQLGELYWWKYYGLILAIVPVFIVSIAAVVLQIYVNRDHARIKYVLTGKQ